MFVIGTQSLILSPSNTQNVDFLLKRIGSRIYTTARSFLQEGRLEASRHSELIAISERESGSPRYVWMERCLWVFILHEVPNKSNNVLRPIVYLRQIKPNKQHVFPGGMARRGWREVGERGGVTMGASPTDQLPRTWCVDVTGFHTLSRAQQVNAATSVGSSHMVFAHSLKSK